MGRPKLGPFPSTIPRLRLKEISVFFVEGRFCAIATGH